ncbi:unnamed protein product [Allacma fusca]|uniref:Integrase catalytic domain-containing protein n=1 Tax=Allacma fusca TaxID=39272 RepID=A0A8J2P111_9HEXA|nr:unnamed protein product [Allacma fusca]
MNTVKDSMGLDFQDYYAWTDSKVVLYWIYSNKRWNTFVANLVSAIHEYGQHIKWYHIPGTQNPADIVSRGMKLEELRRNDLWWYGPQLLKNAIPNLDFNEAVPERALEEEKKEQPICSFTTTFTKDLSLLDRFSSLTALCRVTAYVYRFVDRCKRKVKQRRQIPVPDPSEFLQAEELNRALKTWIKLVQLHSFKEEIYSITKGCTVSANSPIKTLTPFLDEEKILRVGGRLQRAQISIDQRHPMLLPRSHTFTSLVVRGEHERLLHAGPQAVIASLTRRFWIVRMRDAVRKVTGKCVTCVRLRGESVQQMMGNLPSARVNPVRPFLRVGVDYAGPFEMRVLKGRGQKHYKGYICLFICFVTRAVHLELVSSLTSEGFIATLKRFASRRGKPEVIFSDNGTNFVGANRELKDLWELSKSSAERESVAFHLSKEGISWRFSPPGAPNFGGLWEAGVKSVKFHLKSVIGDTALDYEEMSTVLSQVEACLNSRPLCAMSTDPADLVALTPSHFLIGDVITAIPEADYSTLPTNHLSRWQLSQKLVQHFWKRWSSEHLTRLQQRPKWWATKPNLKLGDLALVKEEQRSPLKWRLGRVQELHPGEDGLVRVVTLRVADGVLKRPCSKLCYLPLDTDDSTQDISESASVSN